MRARTRQVPLILRALECLPRARMRAADRSFASMTGSGGVVLTFTLWAAKHGPNTSVEGTGITCQVNGTAHASRMVER